MYLRGNLYDLIHKLNYYSNLKKHNKQYHKKALFKSFYLSGYTTGFDSEPPCTSQITVNSTTVKYCRHQLF